VRKQIEAILTTPGDDNYKAFYLLDSLGRLRDPLLDVTESSMRGVLSELSKDTSSRTYRLLAHWTQLAITNVNLQRRQDSLLYAYFLGEQELRKSGGVKSDAWQAEAVSPDSCSANLNLELGWTKQSVLDLADSLGLSLADKKERSELRELLLQGYIDEMGKRSSVSERGGQAIASLFYGNKKKSFDDWSSLDSLANIQEHIFDGISLPLSRLIAELSRDTSDLASITALHFYSILQTQYGLGRKWDTLLRTSFALLKEGRNGGATESLTLRWQGTKSGFGDLSSEMQKIEVPFQAAREEYVQHKRW